MPKELANVITIFVTLAGAYFGCATLISVLFEVFAQITGRRARFLRAHLARLFGNQLSDRIYSNPLIRKFNETRAHSRVEKARKWAKGLDEDEVAVAYIDPRDFALTLMHEGFKKDPANSARLVPNNAHLGGHAYRVQTLLETLLEGTSGNPAHIQERIEGWFRRDQEQLSASYGVDSRAWGILLGTLTAMLVGLDTIGIVMPTPLPQIAGPVPISRLSFFLAMKISDQLRLLTSFLIGGLMISQGASFWFTMITRVANLRGEGAKPR